MKLQTEIAGVLFKDILFKRATTCHADELA